MGMPYRYWGLSTYSSWQVVSLVTLAVWHRIASGSQGQYQLHFLEQGITCSYFRWSILPNSAVASENQTLHPQVSNPVPNTCATLARDAKYKILTAYALMLPSKLMEKGFALCKWCGLQSLNLTYVFPVHVVVEAEAVGLVVGVGGPIRVFGGDVKGGAQQTCFVSLHSRSWGLDVHVETWMVPWTDNIF